MTLRKHTIHRSLQAPPPPPPPPTSASSYKLTPGTFYMCLRAICLSSCVLACVGTLLSISPPSCPTLSRNHAHAHTHSHTHSRTHSHTHTHTRLFGRCWIFENFDRDRMIALFKLQKKSSKVRFPVRPQDIQA
jgi:hypothetical protein